MSTSPGAYINNPYNLILAQRHQMSTRAVRFALTPLCDPATNQPKLSSVQLRKQLRTIQIDAAAAGDNVIIPASAGVKQIYEVVLWNVAAQTLIWQQGGTPSLNSIRLLRLTDFPALTGQMLGFNGSFDQPHWEIDTNQPLILRLQNSTQVDGFVRYRVQNGTA
jgi:hypothetical protein